MLRRTTINTNIDNEIEDILNNKQIIQSFGTFTPTDSIAIGSLNNKIKIYKDTLGKSNRKVQVSNLIEYIICSSEIGVNSTFMIVEKN